MATVWLERNDCRNDYLPDVCLKCGRAATTRVKKNFSWMPGWAYLTLLVHLIVFIIVAAVTRKTLKVNVPMCDEHRNHWFSRILWTFGTFVLVVAFIIGLVVLMSEWRLRGEAEVLAGLSIPGSIFLWLIVVVIIHVTAIRATEISDRGVKLSGAHEAFVAAYMEQQRERVPSIPDLDRVAAQRWGDRGYDEAAPRRRDEDEQRYRPGDEDEEDKKWYRPK